MALDPQKVVLYSQSTFDYTNPTQAQAGAMLAAAQDINQSGFGTVILGQWHVGPDGSLFYNDTPMEEAVKNLPVIVAALKAEGTVQKVLIGFGPDSQDFAHIRANLAQFEPAISGLFMATGIDGLDFNFAQSSCRFPGLLIELTQWATCEGKMVTASPAHNDSVQLWSSVLQCASSGECANGEPSAGFAWLNLQLHGGTGDSYWTTFPYWASSFAQLDLDLDPQDLLIPGYNLGCTDSPTPGDIQRQLTGLREQSPNLAGAMIWKYEDFATSGYTATQLAAAVQAGVGGKANTCMTCRVPRPIPASSLQLKESTDRAHTRHCAH